MYKNKKIIACSPVGRKKSLECLFKAILKNKHIIDEYHLWINTVVEEDLEYIKKFHKENIDFVKLKYHKNKKGFDPNNITEFYKYCTKKDTFYFKIDDDIIFIEDGTFEKLAQYKLDNPETFLTYPTIINNYWCTHFLRKHGALMIPECFICNTLWYEIFNKINPLIRLSDKIMSDNLDEPKLTDFISENYFFSILYWRDPQFAYTLLGKTYEYITGDGLKQLDIPNIMLEYEPVSTNFVMWSGEDFLEFNGQVKSIEDSTWLSLFYPIKYGLTNSIVGNTRVVHYSYSTQKSLLDKTKMLDYYKKLY